MRDCSGFSALPKFMGMINEDLKDFPSLVLYLQEIWAECYEEERNQAADETGQPQEMFPLRSCNSTEQALDPKSMPQ
jgi:Domain of unknown function DUF29